MILYERGVVYLAGEPRVGKTPTAIKLAQTSGWKKFCIITKKSAIPGIKKFTAMEPDLDINVVNFEKIPDLINWYDGYIIDEAHSIGAYPKPSNRYKHLKALIGVKPVILMSGTPCPESKSQLFHQFKVTQHGPFTKYRDFYAFAKDFVKVKERWINGQMFKNYATIQNETGIDALTKPFTITVSQVDAGFTSFVEEEVLKVKIDPRIYQLMAVLKKNKVYTFKSGKTIVAGTPIRMQSIFHQISSGTIKFEDESREILDESKAKFIKERFAGQKIAIYYQFTAELQLLQKYFPFNTDDSDQFNRAGHLTFLSQMKSGSMGVNLSSADALVAYNIDFSATTYWQFRARMQELERKKESKLYWIFSENGLEKYVYKVVGKKKNFTSDFFKEALDDIGDQGKLEL